MSKPKIIIFDLLTALLDSWTAWNAAAGSEDTGLRWRLRYLDITFECGEYQPYEQQIATAAREAGLPQTAADALIQDYGQIKPWPEVPRVLQKLRERGYALGVITNCSRNLGHLAASSCEVPFDAVLTAEEGQSFLPPTNDLDGHTVFIVGVTETCKQRSQTVDLPLS